MSKQAVTLEKLRDQPDDELKAQLANTRDELFRLHLGQHTNQVTSTALLRTKRRDIARIMTILNARKSGLETQAAAKPAAPAEETAAPSKKTKKTTKKAKS
jgi:large subunit ribosomal protein L29